MMIHHTKLIEDRTYGELWENSPPLGLICQWLTVGGAWCGTLRLVPHQVPLASHWQCMAVDRFESHYWTKEQIWILSLLCTVNQKESKPNRELISQCSIRFFLLYYKYPWPCSMETPAILLTDSWSGLWQAHESSTNTISFHSEGLEPMSLLVRFLLFICPGDYHHWDWKWGEIQNIELPPK